MTICNLIKLLVPFVNHDKKGEKLWRICGFFLKILHVRRRNTCLCKGEMCFSLLRGVHTSFFLYTGLVTMFIYIVLIFDIYIYIYIWWCMSSSPTSTCVVSFLSLCTCFSLLVCNLLFLFHTKMPWWVLFKVFQKYRLSKSFLPYSLLVKFFKSLC